MRIIFECACWNCEARAEGIVPLGWDYAEPNDPTWVWHEASGEWYCGDCWPEADGLCRCLPEEERWHELECPYCTGE